MQIWDLCYAFFDKAYQIRINAEQKEYLLVKNFNIVFEAIIDELIGDRDIPVGLKEQYNGKRVDHMYSWQGLIENDEKPIYYIGDSKYYKLGNDIGKESVYKQYTYARNVIQWNLDLFMDGKPKSTDLKLRDDVTEGYNVIPNFFISAKMDEGLSYVDRVDETKRRQSYFVSRQFENRLFDRDTLLVFHYDVNFLYVVSLYTRDNAGQKATWKNKVREIFRAKIQEILGKQYQFYAMRQHSGVDGVKYIREHFKQLLGKVYTPFEDKGIYSLALENPSAVLEVRREAVKKENAEVLESLSTAFYVVPCELGRNPEEVLPPYKDEVQAVATTGKNGVLMVMMENFGTKTTRFINDGRIAVGLKYSRESMEIVEHIGEIGYVMFHNRRRDGQHLFAVKSCSGVTGAEDVDEGVYKNVETCEIYLVVEFDGEREMDSKELDCTRVECSPKTRYDAQFARWEWMKNQ